ncbi:MAG TPA: PQQ-dependent dehydrogenase, methanol/ethanol family [bacterium]|nr:PQQ-dependent dehydrogenase, methanol/ethanol family [bacterium]
MKRGWLGVALWTMIAAAVLLVAPQGPSQNVVRAQGSMPDSTALLSAANDANTWLMYGHDYSNDRYSALDQINTSNVSSLVPRWIFQTGVVASFETTPVVSNGVMYITTAYDHLFALNATTGSLLWRYDPKLTTTIFCCGPVNRGVALAYGTVYLATLDARLIALDAATGKVKWQKQIADPTAGYSETMAPIVYRNLVIIGMSGAEYGIRGFVTAYDAHTGAVLWRWYTIPSTGWEGKWSTTTPEGEPLHRNISAEKAAWPKYKNAWQRGGGSMWMTPAIDPQLNMLYMGIGNPSPDLDGGIRPGDNLYTESIVAVNAATGRLAWYYQEVPHDVWDLDQVSPPLLFNVTVNGQTIPAVGAAGKTGWFYVLDRRTGARILRSQGFVRHENLFAQPTAQGVRMLPGANGGTEWSPTSYSPQTQNVYVAALEQPMTYATHFAPFQQGRLWLGSAFVSIPGERQYGTFTAIDVNTGKITWQKQIAQPMMGGSLATAGGLVFTGEGNGHFDAFDAKTGQQLWQFQAGAGVNAAPMAFALGGQEYIAVAAGGNFQLSYPYGDALLVFGLPPR